MNYEETITYIHSFARFGSRPGLDRITKLLSLMDNPQDKLRYIHIAGTNGKGSTTAMCASILKEAGYKTGMFISPYILEFRERIQINGKMIAQSELTQIIRKIKPHIEYLNSNGVVITEFELITAAAFQYFANNFCDIVCLEVGMGGAIDSTNVIKTPEAAVITPVSIDHAAYLGDTVEKIAAVKAGIIKCGGKTICYPLQDINAIPILMEKCAKENNAFILPCKSAVRIVKSGIEGTTFAYEGQEYVLRLMGEYQVYNALTAITAIKSLTAFSVTDEALKKGIRNTRFPARLEIIQKKPFIIIDGSHNLQGMMVTAKALENFSGSVTLILGMLKDKNVEQSVSAICPIADRVICTEVDSSRAMPSKELYAIVKEKHQNAVEEANYRKALNHAVFSTPLSGCILVSGSLYLASEMRKLIAK